MYGTRGAADGWQEECSSALVSDMGFEQGQSSPCVFIHHEKDIAVSVHGDDFTPTGPKSSLGWYEEQLQLHYEVTIQPRIGPGTTPKKRLS